MNLHRPPPALEPRDYPRAPEPTVVNGRWTWPGILYYIIQGPPDAPEMVTIADTPPCEREAPATAAQRKGLNEAEGEPRTPPYFMVAQPGKQAEVDALARSGMLWDDRHRGTADIESGGEAVAPMAYLSMRPGLGPVPYWAIILLDKPTESDFAMSTVIYVIPPDHRRLSVKQVQEMLVKDGGKWPTVQRKKANAGG